MSGVDKTDTNEWQNISEFHDILFRRATASIAPPPPDTLHSPPVTVWDMVRETETVTQ